ASVLLRTATYMPLWRIRSAVRAETAGLRCFGSRQRMPAGCCGGSCRSENGWWDGDESYGCGPILEIGPHRSGPQNFSVNDICHRRGTSCPVTVPNAELVGFVLGDRRFG